MNAVEAPPNSGRSAHAVPNWKRVETARAVFWSKNSGQVLPIHAAAI